MSLIDTLTQHADVDPSHLPLSAFPRLRFSRNACRAALLCVWGEGTTHGREKSSLASAVSSVLPTGDHMVSTADLQAHPMLVESVSQCCTEGVSHGVVKLVSIICFLTSSIVAGSLSLRAGSVRLQPDQNREILSVWISSMIFVCLPSWSRATATIFSVDVREFGSHLES